jgi:hypothetical protein
MNTVRENAYSALFSLLQSIPQIKYCSRVLRSWQETPPESTPAIYLQVNAETRTRDGTRKPPITYLKANIFLYVETSTDGIGIYLNPILDAIDNAIPDGIDVYNILGGVVQRCYVDGTTQIFEGSLGNTAVAIIPVTMLVT